MDKKDAILHRIREVRKTKQRNIHDCAAFLNISKEHYLKFEQGAEMLSLPEIELLARYFGVSPLIFIQANHWEKQMLALLDDHVQPKYKSLRDKIIKAKIVRVMHAKSLTTDQIHQETDVPIAKLNAYLQGEEPIPLDHLLEISRAVSLTPEMLIDPVWPEKDDNTTKGEPGHWQREFTVKEGQNKWDEAPYNQLMLALQKLPKKDKAEVAKFLLKKIKTITKG